MSINLSDDPSQGPDRAGRVRKPLLIATPRSLVAAAVLMVGLMVEATQALAASPLAHADTPSQPSKAKQRTLVASRLEEVRLDHSGQKRVGMASYYGRTFSGRKMADGTLMKPDHDHAASRTLPLGTTAQVRNVKDGKTAVVTIRDRGPYVKGRIIDLSPSTAKQLGIMKAGVARVEVTPITVPQPNGTVKSMVAMSERDKVDAQSEAAASAWARQFN